MILAFAMVWEFRVYKRTLPTSERGNNISLGLLRMEILGIKEPLNVRRAVIDLVILSLAACVVEFPAVIICPNILLLLVRWVDLYGSGS